MRNWIAIALMFLPSLAAAQGTAPLKLSARIPLANVMGRMDHLAVDIEGQRIFATAFDNHTLEVVDLRAGKKIATIPNLDEPQQPVYDPSTNHLFVSSSGDGTVKMFDGRTLRLLHTEQLSADADDVRYDPRHKTVLVGYGGEKFLYGKASGKQGAAAVAILDAASGKVVAEIPADGAHPESFWLEDIGTRIFINLPDIKEIEVGDLASNTVVAHWPATGCSDNFPMQLDEAHHRLFVVCRTPSVLMAFDTDTGKPVARAPLDPALFSDDFFFDAARSRLYVIGRAAGGTDERAPSPGFVEVFRQVNPNQYQKIASYPTGWGAQTGWYVPEWSKLIIATRRQDAAHPGELLIYDAQ
jgi:DNA-binding beta-propeller fold protein YncE